MSASLDISGDRFGRLTVTARAGSDGRGGAMWSCRCDCGKESVVRGSDLRAGHTLSCGCFKKERERDGSLKHGHGSPRVGRSAEYRTWCGMMDRCRNLNSHAWKWYGARGIGVCERWRSFENFLADMGKRPSGKTLDRINNDGNYEPGNCRWATPLEQARNSRRWSGSRKRTGGGT